MHIMKLLLLLPLFALSCASLYGQTPQTSSEVTESVVLAGQEDSPVILFDKREITQGELSAMDQQKIGDIEILSGEEAQERFGKYETHGAIVISSKQRAPEIIEVDSTAPSAPSEKMPDATSEEVKMSFGTNLQAHVLIDGNASTMEALENMDPEEIASMKILKKAVAVKKYGDVAKEGAIEVISKQ